ncbi:unnamed protein product [Rotaria magnacalcarata]|uniref:Uncharacterized protein n=3 Tax=Rotaria magnacalcarata TaxID=392030 RepID=A0A814G8G9_9BILA|nr:unnamed protein product [Rotaria magnacalcarata]CAF1643397.1 unnamed protein product [Rotaria magnacalcarata]CAF1959471.1 unnamed protein product [Rotaria magnacalcarata]CAF2149396.1 unnamed protein product [Rotaria magnacalcarata]CAF2228279.1 unnamed protein product [Rotaria magnacalcarata]
MFQPGKQPVGVSTQDRLMSTSFRYEVNKGKPNNSGMRMQQTAQVEELYFKQQKQLEQNKYEQFKAKWAEQSAWANVALQESSVNKQRGQELLLLRKAHLTVRRAALATLIQNEQRGYEQEFQRKGMAVYKDMYQLDPQCTPLDLYR